MPLINCFDKHPFHELNDIDINMLSICVYNFINLYNITNTSNLTIFDIGTNAGSFIKVLDRFNIKENIHCFEPHPILANKVKEIYPYIKMNEYCIGNTNDNINIYIPDYSVGLSSIIARPVFNNLNQNINVLNVKCKTLDNYCEENNINKIDFIKIDVEGAEKVVFEGAKNLLKNHKIICGVFEVGSTLTDAGTSAEEISNIIEGYGYKINKSLSENDYFFYL